MSFLRLFSFAGSAFFGVSCALANAASAPASTPAPAGSAAEPNGLDVVPTTEFIEHLVDSTLTSLGVVSESNTAIRYAICAGILLVTFLLRRVVTDIVFSLFSGLAKRTETSLDDKLFTTLRSPVASMVVVVGGVAAVKSLKLSATTDAVLDYVYTGAFSLVIFWLFFAAFTTVLDHLHSLAQEKQLGVATLMPWIKKALIAFFFVVGVLMIAQSLGADVKAFLAGLGIGGLAFALAAQDTIANVFGSVVVAIDQPFKVGDVIQVGAFTGTVEDIGLRSTRIRTVARSLLVIPNKTVAAESVINLSRFTQRRVDQMIGITYEAKAEQIEALVEDFRTIMLADKGIDSTSVVVQFVGFGACSLDIQVIYLTTTADFVEHLKVRQRVNVQFMRTVESRGLSFAYPTQTIQLDGPIARQLAASRPVN